MSAVLTSDGTSDDSAVADSDEALDAYSTTVTAVAERLSPSVANVRVQRQTRRGPSVGAGSAVVIAPDGYLLTSAHVVERSRADRSGSETAVSCGSPSSVAIRCRTSRSCRPRAAI